MRIQWKSKFSVSNEKIDNEHKVFLNLVQTCSEAIEREQPRQIIARQLEELRLYALFHFYSEETLMLEIDYEDYERHRQNHRDLIDALEDKTRAFLDGASAGDELILFVFEWFVLHTTTTDQELGQALSVAKSSGLAENPGLAG
jgi:hemerythrin